MALKVYIEFVVKGTEKVAQGVAALTAKINAMPKSIQKTGQAFTQFGARAQMAFTLPLLAITALASRLAMLAPKTKAMETAFNNLRGVGSAMGAQLQRILVPVINLLADLFATIVPYVKALADAFTSLSPTTQKIVVLMALLLASLGPLIKVFGALIAIFGTLSLLATPLALKIALITAAIAALAGAVAFVIRYSEQVGRSLGAAFAAIYQEAINVFLRIQLAFQQFSHRAMVTMEGMGYAAEGSADAILAAVNDTMNALEDSSQKASALWSESGEAISGAFDAAAKDVSDLVDGIETAFNDLIDLGSGASAQFKDMAASAAAAAAATGAFASKGSLGKRAPDSGANSGDRSSNAQAVKEVSQIQTSIEAMVNSIEGSFSGLIQSVLRDTQDAGQALEDFFAQIGDNILKTFADIAANQVMQWILGGGQVAAPIGGIGNEQNSPMGGLFSTQPQGQQGGVGGGMFGGLKSIFDMFLGGGGGANGEEGKGGGLQDIFDTFLTGISEIFGGGQEGGEGSFLSGLVGILSESWEALSGLFDEAWTLLADTLWPLFWELIVVIYDLIAALIVDAISPFATGGSRVVTRPTRILVGEAGPEKFTATPLGQSSGDDEVSGIPTYAPQPMVSGGNVTVVLGQGAIVDGISQYRFANTIARSVRGILGRTV